MLISDPGSDYDYPLTLQETPGSLTNSVAYSQSESSHFTESFYPILAADCLLISFRVCLFLLDRLVKQQPKLEHDVVIIISYKSELKVT